jgi:bifunctional N-acetylglutamate synthase/kinase
MMEHHLVKTIKPKKYILLSESGGILDTEGQLLPFLNISQDQEWTHQVGKTFKKEVKAIQGFIKTVPQTAIVVTSTHHLLQEIFTIKGKGTFIKHHQIETTSDATDLSIKRVTKLLEDAFNKQLTPNYFKQSFKTIMYQKDYEGIAIIQDIAGIPYLDKFAVSKIHEGTGLGKSLWNAITKTYPQLIWRSTPQNPFNSFYMRECDGCIKYPDWIIYWRQLPEDKILKIASKIHSKPASFIAKNK